jgi:hypothetical protein
MKKNYFILSLFLFGTLTITNKQAMQVSKSIDYPYTAGKVSVEVMGIILSFCDYDTKLKISMLNTTTRKYFLTYGTVIFKVTPTKIVHYKKAKNFLKKFNGKTNIVITAEIFNGKDNNRVISRIKRLIKEIKNLNKLQFDAVKITEKQWQKLLFTKKWLFRQTLANVIKQMGSLSIRSSNIPKKILSKMLKTRNNFIGLTFDCDEKNKINLVEILKIIPPTQTLTIEGNGTPLGDCLSAMEKNKNANCITHIIIKDYNLGSHDKSFEIIPSHILKLELHRIFPLQLEKLQLLPNTIKILKIINSPFYKDGSRLEKTDPQKKELLDLSKKNIKVFIKQ